METPTHQLTSLQWFEIDKMAKVEARFFRKWTKEKRCACVDKMFPKTILNCKHVNKAFNKEFKDKIDSMWDRTLTIIEQDKNLPHGYFNVFRGV